MKSLIGITTELDDGGRFAKRYAGKKLVNVWQAYVDAVRDAGGFAILLSPTADRAEIKAMLQKIDGLLITGSASDVPPDFYGERMVKGSHTTPNPVRAAFEKALILGARQKGMPVLGICGGEQIINVAFGGTLYQDLRLLFSKKISHESNSSKNPAMHRIAIKPGTLLSRTLFGPRPCHAITVNSYHHQGVKKPGRGLIASAFCNDGLIEAVEAEKGFVLGVQWHPERMYINSAQQLHLIHMFIRAGREYIAKAQKSI